MDDRRGIFDILFFMITIFTLAVFIIVVYYIGTSINDKLRDDATFNQSDNVIAALDQSDNILSGLNNVFLLVFVGLLMGVLISAALIDVSKIFIPIYILLLTLALWIGSILNYVYEKIKDSTDLSSSSATQTFANTIIDHYVITILIVGVLAMILYFGKTSSGSSRV